MSTFETPAVSQVPPVFASAFTPLVYRYTPEVACVARANASTTTSPLPFTSNPPCASCLWVFRPIQAGRLAHQTDCLQLVVVRAVPGHAFDDARPVVPELDAEGAGVAFRKVAVLLGLLALPGPDDGQLDEPHDGIDQPSRGHHRALGAHDREDQAEPD